MIDMWILYVLSAIGAVFVVVHIILPFAMASLKAVGRFGFDVWCIDRKNYKDRPLAVAKHIFIVYPMRAFVDSFLRGYTTRVSCGDKAWEPPFKYSKRGK